jgi:ADP-ribosylglycohydrolase
MKIDRTHFRGTLLGGATADALAYNTRSGGLRLISDNTQLASFTADGLIWALEKAKKKGVYAYIPCLFYSYQKWYYTQTGSLADKCYSFILNGDILKWEALFTRRGEGLTSLKALEGSLHNKYGTLKNRVNNSKGCGGVMRVAPVGMCFCRDEKTAFRIGCESAALTHGHMGAIAPAGFLAALISLILQGKEIELAAEGDFWELVILQGGDECAVLL